MAEESWWQDLQRTCFGSEAMEERLAALIIAGRKKATVWNGLDENPTKPGMQWVVTANERPVAVIETIAVGQFRFDTVDAAFANEEGEGDKSLLYWKTVHETFFKNEGCFSPTMPLWWETFKLVHVIDQSLADQAAHHVLLEEAEAATLLKTIRQT